jgi:hypothetical protein
MGCHPSGCEPPFQICFAAARAAGFLNLQPTSSGQSNDTRFTNLVSIGWNQGFQVVVGRRVSISVLESDESTTSGQHRRRVSDVIRFERRVGVWLFGPRLPLDHDYVQGCKCGHGRWISGATDEDVRLIGEAIAAEAIRARVEFPESPAIPLEPQKNATTTPLEKGWGRLSWRKVKYFNHLTGRADGTRTPRTLTDQ